MKKISLLILPALCLVLALIGCGEQKETAILMGADQPDKYLPYLEGKNVALAINNSSLIGNQLSLDTLLSLGVNIVKGFGPEHGIRGGNIYDSIDSKTGIPVISLYRGKVKPTNEDLEGVDVMIFDMQNVGTKFYTYKATLRYVMEACAENDIELIVFDRPNPNDYVDGPINEFSSFVGLDPIPTLHGMTMGEYAMMLNGEGWLENNLKCDLNVIKVMNWKHGDPYTLPVAPSPNLNTQQSVLLYPSLCLFEGTVINLGRRTDPLIAFTVIGNPELKDKYSFSYQVYGDNDTTVHYGLDLRNYNTDIFRETGRLNLGWYIELYNSYPDKGNFFRQSADGSYRFDRLAGTSSLREQIIAGKTEDEIRESWEPGLTEYKKMRQKYLLYQ